MFLIAADEYKFDIQILVLALKCPGFSVRFG